MPSTLELAQMLASPGVSCYKVLLQPDLDTMALPKYIRQRDGGIYYVRRALPLDVQAAFGGRKEIWVSLRTADRRDAEARSHAAIAKITDQIEAKRRELRSAAADKEFVASDRLSDALAAHAAATGALEGGGQGFAWASDDPEQMVAARLNVVLGGVRPRPASRAEAAEIIEHDLAELRADRARMTLVRSVGPDGEPEFWGNIQPALAPVLMAAAREWYDARERTMEAQLAVVRDTAGPGDAGPDARASERPSLARLAEVWKAHRKPSASSQADMRTAVARFERVNGPLPYPEITDQHARQFKEDLLADAALKNATRGKLWGLLRALLNVAVDDRLLDANPFARVKMRLDDDSASREVLTRRDLEALFGAVQDEEEWWLFRVLLYTGARLGEVCQLTTSDLVDADGVPCLHIREDAEAGRRVKNKGSVRKVPLHRQLVADGFPEWVAARPGGALFTVGSHAASKRLLRRMRAAGLGAGKVVHSLRHGFKTAARPCMDEAWHDRMTGHAPRSVGETYGHYDLRTLKQKLDLVAFGVET